MHIAHLKRAQFYLWFDFSFSKSAIMISFLRIVVIFHSESLIENDCVGRVLNLNSIRNLQPGHDPERCCHGDIDIYPRVIDFIPSAWCKALWPVTLTLRMHSVSRECMKSGQPNNDRLSGSFDAPVAWLNNTWHENKMINPDRFISTDQRKEVRAKQTTREGIVSRDLWI